MMRLAARATIAVALLSLTSAAPLQPRQTLSIPVTFHGAIDQGPIQSVALNWPLDGVTWGFATIVLESGDVLQNAQLSMSTGEIFNNGMDVDCTFWGLDGLQMKITNTHVDSDDWETFTVGPPQVLITGSCTLLHIQGE
ncbi:hypothetical protein NA57DRAFT_79380 [Rhizodiscina lignyota]|uniref:Uncharacterized protein n=1 Tax=Rhizodiscina lignyota TaxID=1504668 RepID=A0A9P4M3F8_9PEZI|nr:hypothetical protein NA57DRAFT_79380 [Rhizodiscina lignyota]